MTKWLFEKHFKTYGWQINDNHMPVSLENHNYVGPGSEMPILRANYMESQAAWHMHAASLFGAQQSFFESLIVWR